MEETTVTKKRNDVAKPCCGRKRGHADDCPERVKAAPAKDPEPGPGVNDVAEVYGVSALPVRLTAGAFLDMIIDDLAERVAAKLRGVEIDREVDGRVIAEVPSVPGAMAYGPTGAEAVAKAEQIAAEVKKPVVEAEPVEEKPAPAKPSKASQQTIEAEGRTVPPEEKPAKVYTEPKPCGGCGKDENDAAQPHSKACDQVKAEPKKDEKPAAVTFEALREAAVEFAQSKGKPALVALLEKYGAKGPDGVKLSLLADDKRAAFYAELKA